MVKDTVNLDATTVRNVIINLHDTLKEYGLHDNHIALFGSFYSGNPHEDSDMDVIVISSHFEGKNLFERIDMTAKAQIDIKRRYVVPIDILLQTPQEYYNQKYLDSKIII